MNSIEKLIEELCPEGPPIFPVSKFAKIQGGFSFPSSGMNSDGNGLQVIRIGDVNEKGSNKVFFLGEYPKNALVEKGNLLLGLSGDIGVKQWEGNTALLNQRVARIDLDLSLVVPRYVYHFLGFAIPKLTSKVRKSAVANLSMNSLRSFEIPLPPLKIKNEIVEILDKFTQLEAELEAELEARKKQYEALRSMYLDFDLESNVNPLSEKIRELCPEGVDHLPVSSLGHIYPGLSGKTKADFGDEGKPFVNYVDIARNPSLSTRHDRRVKIQDWEDQNYLRKGDILFTASSEDREGVGLCSEVEFIPEERLYLNSFCFGLRPKNDIFATGFAKHLFRSPSTKKRIEASSNGVTRLNLSKKLFNRVEVPIPPLEIQKEIVEILDNLEFMTTSLSSGLPAEIAARKKQYDYYRDKLLTFKELKSA